MRTPPGAGWIRTSRPSNTRCRPPSCQRLARSGPKARDVVEVVEALIGYSPFVEVLGQALRGEDAVRRFGRAAVRITVPHVHELAVSRELLDDRPLARLATGLARFAVLPEDAPAVGPRVDPVRVQLDGDSFALEDRLDQLVEARGDDDEAPAMRLRQLDELAEAGPDPHVLELPAHDLLQRLPHRLELPCDHLAKRHAALAEPLVDRSVDDRVAEAACDLVEEILFGDRAVEVDDKSATHRCEVTPAGSSSALEAIFAAAGSSYQEYA